MIQKTDKMLYKIANSRKFMMCKEIAHVAPFSIRSSICCVLLYSVLLLKWRNCMNDLLCWLICVTVNIGIHHQIFVRIMKTLHLINSIPSLKSNNSIVFSLQQHVPCVLDLTFRSTKKNQKPEMKEEEEEKEKEKKNNYNESLLFEYNMFQILSEPEKG